MDSFLGFLLASTSSNLCTHACVYVCVTFVCFKRETPETGGSAFHNALCVKGKEFGGAMLFPDGHQLDHFF